MSAIGPKRTSLLLKDILLPGTRLADLLVWPLADIDLIDLIARGGLSFCDFVILAETPALPEHQRELLPSGVLKLGLPGHTDATDARAHITLRKT